MLFPDMQPIVPVDGTPDLSTTTLLSNIIEHCCNGTLLHLLRLDYVETLAADSTMTTLQVTSAIRAFRTQSYDTVLKKHVTITPDQLFESYVALVPMLPTAVSSWGLTLAHQYHSALSDDIKQRFTDFLDCLGCGDNEHVFRQCPDREDHDTKQRFFQELFCIKPHLRKHPADAAGIAIVRQEQQRNASALPIQATDPATPTPADPAPPLGVRFDLSAEDVDNTPHMFTNTVTVPVFQERSESRPPMPIAIDNGLPHISIQLGIDPDSSGDQHFEALLDTCSALNTGFDQFHFWLAPMFPLCVAELIYCNDPSKPFEALRLLGVVADSVADRNTLSTHGQLTLVIRYYSPYKQLSNDTGPAILSFALSPNVSTNWV
jgi:hypothetical protein